MVGIGDTVRFTGPAAARRTIAVRDPAMQAFVRGLRPGDQVEASVVDAVAIRVEPMR